MNGGDGLRGWGYTPRQAGRRLTLPEGEEDDRLDHEELEDRAVGTEQLPGSEVKEEEGVESQADRDVVNDGHVEVAAGDTAEWHTLAGTEPAVGQGGSSPWPQQIPSGFDCSQWGAQQRHWPPSTSAALTPCPTQGPCERSQPDGQMPSDTMLAVLPFHIAKLPPPRSPCLHAWAGGRAGLMVGTMCLQAQAQHGAALSNPR